MTRPDGAAPVTALARSWRSDWWTAAWPPVGVVGVGVDAVDLARFARVLGRRGSVADRLFTAGELAYARAAPDPVPRLSTRFAAKEAVMKALGVGLWAYPFHDVEVVRAGLDAPGLVLTGAAADAGRPHRRGPLAPVALPHRSGGRGPGGGRGCSPGHRSPRDRPATS